MYTLVYNVIYIHHYFVMYTLVHDQLDYIHAI